MVLAFIILLLPTQLNHFFWPAFSYVFGLPIDHLAPAIYLHDILIILYILSHPPRFLLGRWPHGLLPGGIVTAFILLNIFISQQPILSLYLWLRLSLLVVFYYSLKVNNIRLPFLLSLLLLSSILPSLLALAQFIHGGSLQGIFYYFGERSFNLATPGISKTYLCIANSCHYYLRPYSTFSHPNVLSAYLALVWLTLFSFRHTLSRLTLKLFYFLTPLIFLVILLAFSRAVFLALLLALVLPKLLKRGIPLIIYIALNLLYWFISFFIHSGTLALSERFSFNQIYLQILAHNPFFGVGLGHSIISLSQAPVFWSTFTHRLFLQPPHNTLLLLLVELGLIPVIFAIYKLSTNHYRLTTIDSSLVTFILVTSLFDHYYITSFQLRLLFVFLVLLYNKRYGKHT